MFELRCRPEISRSLPSCFVHVDCKIPERSGRALGSPLARTALLASSYIAEGTIPLVASAIVQLMACSSDVAVPIWSETKAVRPIEGTPAPLDGTLPVHIP